MTVFDNALRTIFRTMNDAAGLAATFRGVEVKGDFRRGWVTVRGVQTYTTLFECMAADVAGVTLRDRAAGPTPDDTLTVNGVDYGVIEIQPDGNGAVVLVLSGD